MDTQDSNIIMVEEKKKSKINCTVLLLLYNYIPSILNLQ